MTPQIFGRASLLIPTPEQVNQLIQNLKSPDREIRASTVLALGKMPFPPVAAMPALIASLKHKDTIVRFNAAFALGQIRFEPLSAVPELIEAFKDAVPVLTETLKDKDSGVRACAANALGKKGFYAASGVPRLLEFLKDADSEVQGWAAYALGNIAPSIEKRLGIMDGIALTQMLALWQSTQTHLDAMDSKDAPYPPIFERLRSDVRRLVAALEKETQGC